MQEAGLIRSGEGTGIRDFFYDRLMFPITDPRGRTIAFGARALSPDANPKYLNTGETSLFSKGHLLYNFAKARAPALKESTIILAEGYMDVIALLRAGFENAVAPLGTALTEDQLQLLWRVAPEPILCFDGDEAGLRAGLRAERLSLPHLKPGHSLRFAFMPKGEDPDTFIKAQGVAEMKKILDAAEPLTNVLWRAETEQKDFSTPERRAGLERTLGEIVSAITDSKIADYYRRDFDNRVFEAFKRRAPSPGRPRTDYPRSANQRHGRYDPKGRNFSAPLETVSPAVRNSLLARTGKGGARPVKEAEIGDLLLESPVLALKHGELLAELPFLDRSLDRLRHELLNLAASGSRLEKQGLEDHLVRSGLAELVERFSARDGGFGQPDGSEREGTHAEDIEARFLGAATQLRDMAERDPERARAVERFKTEATEENWNAARRLLGRTQPVTE